MRIVAVEFRRIGTASNREGRDIIAIYGNCDPLVLKGAISLYQERGREGGDPVILYIPEAGGGELPRLIRRCRDKGYRIVTASNSFTGTGKNEVKVNSLTVVTDGSYKSDPLSEAALRVVEGLNAKIDGFGLGKDKYGNWFSYLHFSCPVSCSGWDEVSRAVRSMCYPEKTGWRERFERGFLTVLYAPSLIKYLL
jgi:hypothetical protein